MENTIKKKKGSLADAFDNLEHVNQTKKNKTPQPETEEQSSYYIPPSRRGKKPYTLHLNSEAKQQLKELSYITGKSIQDLIKEGINFVFQKNGKSQIA